MKALNLLKKVRRLEILAVLNEKEFGNFRKFGNNSHEIDLFKKTVRVVVRVFDD